MLWRIPSRMFSISPMTTMSASRGPVSKIQHLNAIRTQKLQSYFECQEYEAQMKQEEKQASDLPQKATNRPVQRPVSRRGFLGSTAGVLAAFPGMMHARPARAGTASVGQVETRNIELPLCTLRLDQKSGTLVGIAWKDPQIEVIKEPRLGENFRLLLPRPDYESNYFYGAEQPVNRIEEIADGVACYYDSLTNPRQTVDVKVRYEIRAVEGRLEFGIQVNNSTDQPLAEVAYGIIGGQQGLGERLATESLVPGILRNLAPGVFSNFRSSRGYNLGVAYSEGLFTYPGTMPMGWIEFFNRKENLGLYYANHDPEPRLTGLSLELRPFTNQAAGEDNWPAPEDLPVDEPVGVTMTWIKFPYVRQGRFKSGSVALQVHRGDWHEGCQLYRSWFDQHFQVRRAPSWLRKEMAWSSVFIAHCEDVIRYRFKDLPKLAADAKKYGVTTLHICGWSVGGIDRGFPQYRPDPRLGTQEEFRAALAEIKKMGVHPLIFANSSVADTATPLFKEKLHRYVLTGRWAEDFPAFGWGEGTSSARMRLTEHKMTTLSLSHPGFREFEVEQFVQLAKDGADGFELDKSGPGGALDFNPALPTSPDRSLPEGILTLFKETLQRCREVNPEFALAAETFWDRTYPYIDMSYGGPDGIDMESTALRFAFPECICMVELQSPGDFNMANNGMRYGLLWEVDARDYTASMDDPLTRPLARYVQELIRIRSKHRDLLFHGRFRDTLGAVVKGGEGVRYSVFEGIDKPGKACVVVNFRREEQTAEVSWPGGEGQAVEVLEPFQPDVVGKLPVSIVLPPRTCAVVVKT